jgi:hypothetical protein
MDLLSAASAAGVDVPMPMVDQRPEGRQGRRIVHAQRGAGPPAEMPPAPRPPRWSRALAAQLHPPAALTQPHHILLPTSTAGQGHGGPNGDGYAPHGQAGGLVAGPDGELLFEDDPSVYALPSVDDLEVAAAAAAAAMEVLAPAPASEEDSDSDDDTSSDDSDDSDSEDTSNDDTTSEEEAGPAKAGKAGATGARCGPATARKARCCAAPRLPPLPRMRRCCEWLCEVERLSRPSGPQVDSRRRPPATRPWGRRRDCRGHPGPPRRPLAARWRRTATRPRPGGAAAAMMTTATAARSWGSA